MTAYAKWTRLLRKEGEAITIKNRAVGSANATTGIPAITRAVTTATRGYLTPILMRRTESEAGPLFTATADLYSQHDLAFGDRFTYNGDEWEAEEDSIQIRRKGKTLIYKAAVVKLEVV